MLITFSIISPQPLHLESPYLLTIGLHGQGVWSLSLFEHTKYFIVGCSSAPLSKPKVRRKPPHRVKAGQRRSNGKMLIFCSVIVFINICDPGFTWITSLTFNSLTHFKLTHYHFLITSFFTKIQLFIIYGRHS